MRGIGTLWFLPVLMIGEYIFAIVRNSNKSLLLALIFMAMTLAVNYAYNSYWLPMRDLSELNKIIDAPMQPFVRGLYAWPIIAIGYFMGKKRGIGIMQTNKIRLPIISALIFAVSFVLVIKPLINIYYINGVLSNTLPAIAFMCLFAAFQKNIITRFFTYWGVNSLILMCTHFSITMEILMVFDKHVLHHQVFEGPITILYFVICILVTYPLVWLFNGKLNFMLGKK